MIAGPIQLLGLQAKQLPNAPVIYYAGRVFSFLELRTLSRKLAARLQALGIGHGDLIAIHFANPFMGWVCSLGLFQLGAISCLLTNVSRLPKNISFKFYLTDNEAFETDDLNAEIISIDGEWLQGMLSAQELEREWIFQNEEDICRLVMSSGSTGESKAVPLSIGALMNRSRVFHEIDSNLGCELLLSDTANSVGLYKAIAPLFSGKPISFGHSYQQINQDLNTIPITNIVGSPLQLSTLLDYFEQAPPSQNLFVQNITSVGSSLSISLSKRLFSIFGSKANIRSIYGSTELGPVAIFPINVIDESYVELGNILPFVTLEIIDSKNKKCAVDITGEIRARSDYMSHEYFRDDSDITQFKDAWFYPGDLGVLTKDGKLVLSGRNDSLFNIGGVKVNSFEIEKFLLDVQGIKDAYCFKESGPKGIDQVYVALVLTEPVDLQNLTQKVIAAFGASLAIRLVDIKSMPLTPAGKLSKAKVRKLVLELI